MNYKTLLSLFLVLCSIVLSSCKKDDWMDWKAQNQLWLQQNETKPDVQTTETGLQYKIIADPNPTDARPNASSVVYCDYRGTLINGVQFDGGTSTLLVSNVVEGFAEGLKKIHCHGDIEIYIPYELGYKDEAQGTEGTASYIPPYSTLIFTIHLRSVQ